MTDMSVNTPKILYDNLDFIAYFQMKPHPLLYRFLEVVSKYQIAFESKAQADPPSPLDERRAMAGQVKKRSIHPGVCEHFKEVCNAAIGRQMGF